MPNKLDWLIDWYFGLAPLSLQVWRSIQILLLLPLLLLQYVLRLTSQQLRVGKYSFMYSDVLLQLLSRCFCGFCRPKPALHCVRCACSDSGSSCSDERRQRKQNWSLEVTIRRCALRALRVKNECDPPTGLFHWGPQKAQIQLSLRPLT